MTKTQAVGIDLGTTYSAVARIDDTGRSAMVRNSQGDLLTPSVVLFEDREIIVGKEAKKAVGILIDRVAECVKRDMGSPVYSKPIRGERLPPEVIQSCILRKLKNDTVAALGPDIKVVITVPAYFDEARRKATADAGEMAGLEVLDIVNEPTAAALAFGEHLGYLDPTGAPRQQMKVVVYDLGGGTFDVTVIDLTPGNIRTLATDGDVRLGGRDWDERLADYLADEFQSQHGVDLRTDPAGHARLLQLAEEAKHTVSARPQALVHIEHAGRSKDVTVTREKFLELTAALLERTSHTTRQVLSRSNLQWRDISHVLLVGGSTRMPMVREMLEVLTGLTPDPTVHPDEAVARGAAVYAGYLLASRDTQSAGPKFKVIDVNAHALGIEGIDQRTLRKENVVLIKRNTALPYRVTEKFVTKSAGQKSIVVQVLEGDSKLPEECSPIGRAVMRHLPPELPKNWPVEVTYEYGSNGRLSVRAKLPGTSNDLTIELEREKGLSDERVAKWKRIVTEEQGFDAFEDMLDEVLRDGALDPIPAIGNSANPTGPKPVGPKPAMPAVPKSAAPQSSAPQPLAPKPLAPKRVFPQPIDKAGGAAVPTTIPTARPAAPRPVPTASTSPQPAQPAKPSFAGSMEIDTSGGVAPGGRSSQHSTLRMLVNISGHILAATAGLVLGYYILCYIAPEANFLNLSLPGLPPPAAAPQQPGTPPANPQ